ncbi:Thiopurine S-methyltransferase (TPMT) [Paraoerskovia marina]|uniref:Thiopurine S-methyltransferase (TPMT) n=1 Tax=Paraoerskovia marina TaxID=545619 RepID=A0A1H1M7I7_9CELL|nr:class I SAM-dependent methyltransferase [Paraoerskovia marina]SDR82587.1 Thiopurine S-methyltransferase (TPMT) [Paraoerskovia marina]
MENPPHDAEFWDERYRSAPAVWSGRPNPRLVEHAGDLAPGRALDVGCGEGADVLWLAERGWQVTGVDLSQVALDRAAGHVAQAGPDVAARATWERVDLLEWSPSETYDLVNVQFMHLPTPTLRSVHRRLAAAVRPGGTLLIVGHHPSDREVGFERPRIAEMLFMPAAVAESLGTGWEIMTAAAAPREATNPDGEVVTIHDTVVRAVRR